MENTMDSNLNRILKEFEELKGQFVITNSWTIERLVAIGDDDMDYYYITYDGRKLTWNTCVGKLVRLKNKIDEKDYNDFIRLAKMNHFDQENLWLPKEEEQKEKILRLNREHKLEITTLSEPNRFLTEVCWELN
jgi:hypothetical protein